MERGNSQPSYPRPFSSFFSFAAAAARDFPPLSVFFFFFFKSKSLSDWSFKSLPRQHLLIVAFMLMRVFFFPRSVFFIVRKISEMRERERERERVEGRGREKKKEKKKKAFRFFCFFFTILSISLRKSKAFFSFRRLHFFPLFFFGISKEKQHFSVSR